MHLAFSGGSPNRAVRRTAAQRRQRRGHMDLTTDPALRSFVPVAPDSHFPIQNLPFGIFRRHPGGTPHVGVAIGDTILDLWVLEESDLLAATTVAERHCFRAPALNAFLALGP